MQCKYKYRFKLKRNYVLLVLSIFIYQLNFAQEALTKNEKQILKNEKQDLKELSRVNSDYIYIFPKNKILIGHHFGGIDNRFILRDNENENYYHLGSSIVPSSGLHFKYKRLPTISFSLPLNLFSKNADFITKGYNFGLHFQASRLLIFDAYFFKIDGLKLLEIDGVKLAKDSTYHGSRTLNVNMEMFFVFNNAKFSYKNAYLSGESQKKSAGTVVLGISYNYFSQKNKATLFNPNNIQLNSLNYRKNWGFSMASMIGYLHTFVIAKKWYLGGGLLYGPNLHFGKAEYNSEQKNTDYFSISGSFKAKFSAGFNSKHVLLKVIGHSGFYGYRPNKNNEFNNYITDFRLSFTYVI